MHGKKSSLAKINGVFFKKFRLIFTLVICSFEKDLWTYLYAKRREVVSYKYQNDAMEIFAFHKSANL